MRLKNLYPDMVDVVLDGEITLHLTLDNYEKPGIWSITIDGEEYREPGMRDDPEILKATPFTRWVEDEIGKWRATERQAQQVD